MAKNLTSDTEQSRTMKTALALYMLLENNASHRPCNLLDSYESDMEKIREMDVLKSFVSSRTYMLNEKINELDSARANAFGLAKFVDGSGTDVEEEDKDFEVDDDDEESKHVSMKSLATGKAVVTNQARMLAKIANRCDEILKGDFISIKDADFLIRGVTELVGTPVFEAWSGKAEDAEKNNDRPVIDKIMGDFKNSLKMDPYCRLRTMVSDMFGTGAVKELEGIKAGDAKLSRVSDQDLTNLLGIKNMLLTVGGMPVLGSAARWDVAFTTELSEIIGTITDGKGNLKESFKTKNSLLKEDMEVLRLYAGLPAGTEMTPSDCLKAVNEKETSNTRLVEYIVGDKKVQLPLDGLGHVLNPAIYAKGENSPMTIISNMFRDVRILYSGRQTAIQNKLLTAARVLCGINERGALNKMYGESWFQESLADSPSNNAVPYDLQQVAGKNLSDLVATYFAIDSEYSKLMAIPTGLLWEKSPTLNKINKECDSCYKVLERMKTIIRDVVNQDGMKEYSRRISDANVDVDMFHLIEFPADERSSSAPYILAAQAGREMFSGLYYAIENNKMSSKQIRALAEHLRDRIDNSESGDRKEFAIRMAEALHMNINPLPVGWQKKTPEEAYAGIIKDIETIKNSSSRVLDNLLAGLKGYEPWDKSYGEIVKTQVERRKQFEIGRVGQWTDVFCEAFDSLTKPRDFGTGTEMNYTEAVTYASKSVNVMIAAVLCDCVMKNGGLREKSFGGIGDEEFSIMTGRYARASEGETLVFDPVEDVVCNMIMTPFSEYAYNAAIRRRDKNFAKFTDKDPEIEPEELLGRGFETIDSGSMMNFSSSIVSSDEVLGSLIYLNTMHAGARTMPAGEGRDAIMKYCTDAMENILEKIIGKHCTQDQYDIADQKCLMSAEEQYALVGFALDEWRHARELRDNGNEAEAEKSMEKALGYIDDAKENNPHLRLWGYSNAMAEQNAMTADEIKQAMKDYDPSTENYLKSLKYADLVAQFNVRIGNNDKDMLMKLSRKALLRDKYDSVLAAKEFEQSVRGDKKTALRIAYGMARTFSSRINMMLNENLMSGKEAEEWSGQIERSKGRLYGAIANESVDASIIALCNNFSGNTKTLDEKYRNIGAHWSDPVLSSFTFGRQNGEKVYSHTTETPASTDPNLFGTMQSGKSGWGPTVEWINIVDKLFKNVEKPIDLGYGLIKARDLLIAADKTSREKGTELDKWDEMEKLGPESYKRIAVVMDAMKEVDLYR